MTKTLRERFEIALKMRGETLTKRLARKLVYTRKEGGYYYLGKSGSLRHGETIAGSIPVSDKFKQLLLELTMERNLTNV